MAKDPHTIENDFLRYDIDWFCRINNVNIHVASRGRAVPDIILRTLPNLRIEVSHKEMKTIENMGGIWYNRELIETWLELRDTVSIARYLCSFAVMARKGFYSFAPITFDPTDQDYYLMMKPERYEDFRLEGMVEIPDQALHVETMSPMRPINFNELIAEYFNQR